MPNHINKFSNRLERKVITNRFSKHSNQLVHASLTVMTLIAGMGVTPAILADKITTDQTATSGANTTTAKSETTVPTIEEPAPLPTADLAQPKLGPVKTPKGKSSVATSENAKKAVKDADQTKSVKKAKSARAAMQFTRADFNITNGGTTIDGFSAHFWDDIYPTLDLDWDGSVSFSPELADITTIDSLYSLVVTSIDFANLTSLETISTGAFYGYENLKSVSFNGAINLQTIGNSAFYNCPNLESVDFTGATSLTTIGNASFELCSELTAVDFTPLTNLATIGASAFSKCTNLASANFTNLANLESIGDGAFLTTGLERVDLVDLPSLQTIGIGAFSQIDNLQIANLKNLPLLETINTFAFEVCPSLTTVNFAELPAVKSIGYYAFGYSGLTTLDLSPLTNLELIDMGAFIDNDELATVNFTGLTGLKTIGVGAFGRCLSLATVDFSPLTNLETISGSAFDSTPLTEIDLSPLTKLTTIGAYAFGNHNVGDVIDPNIPDNLQRVTIGDNAGLTVAAKAFYRTKGGGMVIPTGPSALANAELIRDTINTDQPDWTSDADNWYIAATVTYKYVNQNNQTIAPNSIDYARIDDQYQVTAAPQIDGYENPEVVGDATFTIDNLWQDVTYKYSRAQAQAFTIYRVDTDGNNLAAPEVVTGDIDGILDLTPTTFAGFDFQELYGSAPTNPNTRARTDFTWQSVHELIGNRINYNDNNGRSYKFVYTKNVPTDTDNNSNGGTNDEPPVVKPGTGGSGSQTPTTPPASPTDNPNGNAKAPTHLPGSGGKQSGDKDTGSKPNAAQVTSTATGANKPTDTSLPKAGSAMSVVLPVLGATILTGALGLYVFNKKRRS